MTASRIGLRVEQQYGNTRRYVVDPSIARILENLTGHKSITDNDIQCLTLLGLEFVEIEANGRRIASVDDGLIVQIGATVGRFIERII